MKFVVGDYMDAVLGETQFNGNVMLRYSFVCHDAVMNLGSPLLCGDGDWPSVTFGLSRSICRRYIRKIVNLILIGLERDIQLGIDSHIVH